MRIAGAILLSLAALLFSEGARDADVHLIVASIAILLFAGAFFAGVRILQIEMKSNPLRRFTKEPENFEIVEGFFTSAFYQSNHSRNLSKFIAEGRVKIKSGYEYFARETFHLDIGHFRYPSTLKLRFQPGLLSTKPTLEWPLWWVSAKASLKRPCLKDPSNFWHSLCNSNNKT